MLRRFRCNVPQYATVFPGPRSERDSAKRACEQIHMALFFFEQYRYVVQSISANNQTAIDIRKYQWYFGHPTVATNVVCKYADDTTLLVPEVYDVKIEDELENIIKRSNVNKLQLNLVKSKEILFRLSNVQLYILPVQFDNIERLECMKLLVCVLPALLHGTLVVSVSQTLRHWTEGATYIRQGGHHVGHWALAHLLVLYGRPM